MLNNLCVLRLHTYIQLPIVMENNLQGAEPVHGARKNHFWVSETTRRVQWGRAAASQRSAVHSPSLQPFLWSQSRSPPAVSTQYQFGPWLLPVLPPIRYGSPGAVMLCYNMAVSWMNSTSTLCVCLPCCSAFRGVCLPLPHLRPSLWGDFELV